MKGEHLISTYGAKSTEMMQLGNFGTVMSLPLGAIGSVGAAGNKGQVYFRGGNSFEMSAADLRASVDKTTGLMSEKGLSLNTNHLDPFVQKYGGAWQLDVRTVPNQLQIKFTSGTHFELTPIRGGTMTPGHYQNLANQVQVFPFNIWPRL